MRRDQEIEYYKLTDAGSTLVETNRAVLKPPQEFEELEATVARLRSNLEETTNEMHQLDLREVIEQLREISTGLEELEYKISRYT